MAVGGALMLVFSKNAIHSIVGFLLSMLAVAGCYLTLSAEFLAVAQLLVYAGGIVVLFLFVVMLVEMTKYKEKGLFQVQAPYAVAAVLAGAVVIISVFWKTWFAPAADHALTLSPGLAQGLDVATHNAEAVSRGIFAQYLLPFEILSVILLVALVGAVVLAKTDRV
jgi:NADH-quinone oxidoreductase subunit J